MASVEDLPQPYDATKEVRTLAVPPPLKFLQPGARHDLIRPSKPLTNTRKLVSLTHIKNYTMISQIARRRLLAVASRRAGSRCSANSRAVAQRRTVSTTPAPKPGDGPLMSRRADRELPGEWI